MSATPSSAKATPRKSRKGRNQSEKQAGKQAGKRGDRHRGTDQAQRSPEDWPAWTAHLRQRRHPKSIVRWIKSSGSCLAWALPDAARDPATVELLEQVHQLNSRGRAGRKLARRLEDWLEAATESDGTSDADSLRHAYQCLAWTHGLPALAAVLPAAPWNQLLDRLVEVAEDAAASALEVQPLATQLLAAELPLTLAAQFPELSACAGLRPSGRAAAISAIDQLLDGEGLPEAKTLSIYRPLIASWTRCVRLAPDCLDEEAGDQYEWIARRIVQFARRDGGQLFAADAGADEPCPELIHYVLKLGGNAQDQAAAALAFPGPKPDRKAAAPATKVESGIYSEWSELAVMRGSWARGAPHLGLRFDDSRIRSELFCGRHCIWSGEWTLEIRVNGKEYAPTSWEEVCWNSDHDVHYLELETDCGPVRVQRHVLMSRDDDLLLIGDAVLGDEPAKIEYTARLPLDRQVRFQPARDTREGWLVGKRKLGLVVPLAEPEWRSEPADSRLVADPEGLAVHVETEATRFFAPLAFDLDRQRVTKPFTWRRLTVAQRLEIQPPDVAVGFRLQANNQQWLLYRSLATSANRSVLGQNLSSEFYFGRFFRDGEVEDLIEIESED